MNGFRLITTVVSAFITVVTHVVTTTIAIIATVVATVLTVVTTTLLTTHFVRGRLAHGIATRNATHPATRIGLDNRQGDGTPISKKWWNGVKIDSPPRNGTELAQPS